MDEVLQKITAFPPSQPLSDIEYDKMARNLSSLLHHTKLLGGGAELINVWSRKTLNTQVADESWFRPSVHPKIPYHFSTS
jgi:hypothetical protein